MRKIVKLKQLINKKTVMKKRLLIFLFIFPVIVYGQEFRCGNALRSRMNSISLRHAIKPDTVINGNTIWVYPYFYQHENYLILSDDIPNGSYNAYYFDETSLAFTVTYIKGKPEGVINSYYKSGSLRATRINHKGKPVGQFTNYYPDGTIYKRGMFTNGKLDSAYYEYWNNGTVKIYSHYHMDNKTGTWIEYYENGQKKSEGIYVKNKKNGEWKGYSEDGQILKTEYYIKDELISH